MSIFYRWMNTPTRGELRAAQMDEIERRVAKCHRNTQRTQMTYDYGSANAGNERNRRDVRRLRAENAQLREALKEILCETEHPVVCKIAWAALNAGQGT